MAVLIRRALVAGAVAALATLGACYDPTVRDCVVSCTGAGQCAGDQVCGADGWCAAPAVAGSCATADAAIPMIDAAQDAPVDASPMVDAASATLRLVISGKGKIVSDQPGVQCTNNPGDCSFSIAAGTAVVLTAVNTNPNYTFVDWATPNCQGQGTSCTLTVAAPVSLVTATFE
ncbi:MAG: hypothetical protein K8W52_04485 [Deltaproteobacteria bacterium]|nr:hypothetical protein [Deltaproteobacteria bacterium]